MDRQRPQILIVDDQTGIRTSMAGIIENLDFPVVDVEDGYQAIDRVRNDRFDLVFLDIKMPGINGIQTLREIKKLNPDSLVVMMTGFDVGEMIEDAFNEGAMFAVHKPFEPEQIVNIIGSIHNPCSSKLPTNISGQVSTIQTEIDSLLEEPAIARVTVRIPDAEFRALRLFAVSGPAAETTQNLCSSASLGGIAFYGNDNQVINDYASHPLSSESEIELGIKSALAIPIHTDWDRILGSMVVSCYEADYFYPAIVEKFSKLALDIGNQMETASPTEAEFLHDLNSVGISTGQKLVDVNR